MSKNIFLSGIYHETHTFLGEPTTLKDFIIYNDQEIINENTGNGSPTDGFIEYASQQKWNIIPGIQMSARPSGTVDEESENYFKKNFFEKLKSSSNNIDAIFLVLHGAMVSKNHDDFEGDFLRDIQIFLSKENISIPVVAVLDLHANVSESMIKNSTCVYAYRKNPHSDSRETAVKAASILNDLFLDPKVEQIHLGTNYILPPTGVGTANDPMKIILEEALRIEKNDPEIICINVMAGYSYADIPECGFSINCCTRGNTSQAKKYLDNLVTILEAKIKNGYPKENSLDEALKEIDKIADIKKPILLIEPADNIGGGTPGDATDLLGRLLKTNHKGIVAIINDPEAVDVCYKAQIHNEIKLHIGQNLMHFMANLFLLKQI